MKEFPKIQSIYKREPDGKRKFLEGQWSLPEFEYLQHNQWEWTEKVDGTNIRVIWTPEHKEDAPLSESSYDVPESVTFKGKTDKADIPKFLLEKLQETFPPEKFKEWDYPICLYGEGYGARIQKGGGNYIANGVDFVLFDVWIDGWWLARSNMMDIASKLGIRLVPVIKYSDIREAIWFVRNGFRSTWGDFQAEGLVGKPCVELHRRIRGERIITKLKTKDFYTENENGRL